MAPIIGIAPCRTQLADYIESIRRAGGDPRVFDPAGDTPAGVVGTIGGLLLTGGPDVDPALYGQERLSVVSAVDRQRDEYEKALVLAAAAARVPVLAICRGLQILNVAHGGDLVQDIPTQLSGTLPHSLATPLCAMAHEVWITKGSLLASLMQEKLAEADACTVNSRHHQAIKRVAKGFEVTATAPDGVIEAIEFGGSGFCLGVQWHPENFWRTGEFRPIFEGFVEACASSRRSAGL